MAKVLLHVVRPDRIHGVDATLEQLYDQTRELYDSITAEAQAGLHGAHRPLPSPPISFTRGRIECPSCHVLNAIHTYARHGRTTYYCPNCDHSWSELPRRT